MKELLISKNEKILKIVYKVLNPGGNKTAIVFGNNYNKEERKIINTEILRNNKDVEQVGFISEKENKLEMAGGEFCVNATRCAIWEYLKGKRGKIRLEFSDNYRLRMWVSEDTVIDEVSRSFKIKINVYGKVL